VTKDVKVAVVGIVGSIMVALITTLGTIYANQSGIGQAKAQIDSLNGQARTLRLSTLPIGSIVPSLLTPVQFAKEAGDPPTFDLIKSKWTLADDKGKVPGTRYAELTENSAIPDVRGTFLRGKNNGRRDGRENPENKELGEFQDDQFQDHVHEYNRGGGGVGANLFAAPATNNDNTPRAPTVTITEGKHGTETRPRNVTVNYYIRIN
jgi:hypothetical protein